MGKFFKEFKNVAGEAVKGTAKGSVAVGKGVFDFLAPPFFFFRPVWPLFLF